jgi:hypothetical protein
LPAFARGRRRTAFGDSSRLTPLPAAAEELPG